MSRARHRRRQRRERIGAECVYCGRPATSVDHVPPENLFPGTPPAGLVTVPSCDACNHGASLDDEYFRLIVTLRYDIDHPDAHAASDVAIRGFARPQASRFLKSFLAGTQEVELITPAGLYAGRSASYEFDVERLHRVVRRTAVGLFYRVMGRRLPDGYTAKAWLLSEAAMKPGQVDALDALKSTATKLATSAPPTFIGRRVFSYWWLPVGDEDPNCTAWLMVFYQRVGFLTATSRTER